MDKAGKKYWNDTWADSRIPNPINPSLMDLDNLANRRFHNYFVKLFRNYDTKSMRILELGCAKSAWLPYFSIEFGFEVVGIDYSPIGCDLALQVLKRNGIEGDVFCADFFSPSSDLLGAFDVVVSFGVIEHFEDTASSISALSAYLKPGGIIITIIPNMVGVIGGVQKIVNRAVYDIHRLIDAETLKNETECAGLQVLSCDYFMATNFGVCNLNGISSNTISWFLKKVMLGLLTRISKIIWIIEEKIGTFRPTKLISPYVICVARK